MADTPAPEQMADNDPNPGFEVIPTVEVWEPSRDADRLAWWVRMNLAIVGIGLVAVFTIAALLHPYDKDGRPKTQETHRQMGLPPCGFLVATGLPCPSCGFTTSFSLVAHADLRNAIRANSVGTLLALFGLTLAPWALWSATRGRMFLVRSIEKLVITSLIFFVVLMMTRWAIILIMAKVEGRI